jgi:hypothetical protein
MSGLQMYLLGIMATFQQITSRYTTLDAATPAGVVSSTRKVSPAPQVGRGFS